MAVDPFRIHIDQTHMDSSQLVLKRVRNGEVLITVLRRGKPFFLFAPANVGLGCLDIFTAKAEAKCLQAHIFISNGAGKQPQVRPG